MTPFVIFLILLASAALPYAIKSVRELLVAQALLSTLIAVVVGVFVWPALSAPMVFGHFWHIDAIGAVLTWVVASLALFASWVSVRYIGEEYEHQILSLRDVRVYAICLPLFVLSMFAALWANHTGLLWVALEATTLTTTLLVALYHKDGSIEAAWKYILLCSIGISLGLLGMLLTSYAGMVNGVLESGQAMLLSTLRGYASVLSPDVMKWAFVFILIGIGTKIGLVPMHTWLPDAHSKTPSPISAMLSGVLLTVAWSVMLRFKTLTDSSLGSTAWSDGLLLGFGALTVAYSVLFLLKQKNYKRLLAYSSVEHMGLATFAAGLGPVGMAASLLHVVGHAFAKSALFFGAGEFLLAFKTTKILGIRNAYRRFPVLASLFLIALLFLLAVPPSPLFMSEWRLVLAAIFSHPWLIALVLVSLVIAVVGMLQAVLAMLFEDEDTEHPAPTPRCSGWNITTVVMTIELLLLVALGGWMLTEHGAQFLQRISDTMFAL